jgi:hypothetical protein
MFKILQLLARFPEDGDLNTVISFEEAVISFTRAVCAADYQISLVVDNPSTTSLVSGLVAEYGMNMDNICIEDVATLVIGDLNSLDLAILSHFTGPLGKLSDTMPSSVQVDSLIATLPEVDVDHEGNISYPYLLQFLVEDWIS